MAGRLKFLPRSVSVFALLVGAVGLAYGEGGADPMRPPAAIAEPAPASPEGVPSPSGLQTIIIGKGHKPMAVINGVTVGLGDKVGDATLVKLNETEAVLQGPAGREILYLTPGVERTESLGRRQGISVDQTDRRPADKTRSRPAPTQ